MKHYRLLTKVLFGWDWVIVRWGDHASYVRVHFTNMGKPYACHLSTTYFLDEDHGGDIIGDTFEYPVNPVNVRQVA